MRADLNGHLKALKDYFLLAKGDFFQVAFVQFSSCCNHLYLGLNIFTDVRLLPGDIETNKSIIQEIINPASLISVKLFAHSSLELIFARSW